MAGNRGAKLSAEVLFRRSVSNMPCPHCGAVGMHSFSIVLLPPFDGDIELKLSCRECLDDILLLPHVIMCGLELLADKILSGMLVIYREDN